MATNIERAKAIIDSRRESAEAAAEKKRIELEAISPELKDINYKISRAGLDALRVVGNGGGAEALEELAKLNLKNQEIRAEILKGFGLPADALEVHYTCPICEDTGIANGRYCECLKALVKQLQFENLCSCAPAKNSTFEVVELGVNNIKENHDTI